MNTPTIPNEPGCTFLDKDLRRAGCHEFSADELRQLAKGMDEQSAQCCFLADLLDGRMFKVTHWITN